MKNCFKCNVKKPSSEFYKHSKMADGLLGKCKNCTKLDVSDRYKKLFENPAWLKKERERCRIKQERYRMSGLAVGCSKESRKRWAMKNMHKIAAHKIARRSAKTGEIATKTNCESCNRSGALQMHHPDYSKPTHVIWLCTKCHGIAHRKDRIDILC